MSEFRDLSRLPSDQAYWDDLEARIVGQAVGAAKAGEVVGPGWWAPLASRALALGGLAAAAGIAALLLVPPRIHDSRGNSTTLLRLPHDPGMVAFLSAPEPPSLVSLMASLLRSSP